MYSCIHIQYIFIYEYVCCLWCVWGFWEKVERMLLDRRLQTCRQQEKRRADSEDRDGGGQVTPQRHGRRGGRRLSGEEGMERGGINNQDFDLESVSHPLPSLLRSQVLPVFYTTGVVALLLPRKNPPLLKLVSRTS